MASLRKAFKDDVEDQILADRRFLQNIGTLTHLNIFLGDGTVAEDPSGGYIYILSTRENRDNLEIGVTTRSAEQRVKEINSATGVLVPFGVRHLWNVKEPNETERRIHELLADYRIRNDREFFQIDYHTAKRMIDSLIKSMGKTVRMSGTVRSVLKDKNYGFITTKDGTDYFFYAKDLREIDFGELTEGQSVEFDHLDKPEGPAAKGVTIRKDGQHLIQ